MNKPKTHKRWAEEAIGAFNEARKQLQEGYSPVANKYEIYRHAPILAAQNRDISGTDRGLEMLSVINDIEHDFEVDAEAKGRYLCNFVLAYIHCHAYADFVEEIEADRIMDYIVDNYDLFGNV
jgi:hypothetical protein